MGPLQIGFAALLQFAFTQNPLDFLDVSGTLLYYQWSCTFPISTFLIFWSFQWQSRLMWVVGKADETSVLISLSYSDLSWLVHSFIHLANCHQSQISINLDQVSSSCYFPLNQLTWSHPPFPILGIWPHSSRHVFMSLKIIRYYSLISLTSPRELSQSQLKPIGMEGPETFP